MTDSTTVNYNAVAPGYNQRYQIKGYLKGAILALQALARQLKAHHLLDLGCGTGQSLQAVAAGLPKNSRCYGLDFSAGMLAQAHQLGAGFRLTQATAPWPPFSPASFDMVTCMLAFHHFPHKAQVVAAAYRLLRPGGALAIINLDPRESQAEWIIYKYFEGSYQTDLQRFPSVADQESMLRRVGFQQVSSPIVEEINEVIEGDAILDDYWLRKESSSQLILLTQEAYQAGLNRIKAELEQASARGQTAIFQTYLLNRMTHGFKPG